MVDNTNPAGMSNDLFHAILAMDAYNRGYGAALPGLSDVIGTKLGNATVIGAAGDSLAQSHGFYAIAYESNGKKIISYRGTDDPSILSTSSDLWNGWVQGAGIISTQSEDAIRFYERIAGQSVFKLNQNIVTTGHSLGGGLAGYIAALSNGEAYIFDAMPFASAAMTRVIKEQLTQANFLTGPAELTAFLTTGLSRFVMMPDADKVHYISVDGEVLAPVRTVALTLGSALEIAVATALITSYPTYSLGAPALGLLAGPWALAVGLEGKQSIIDPVASNLGLVNKHSQSLLVLLQYAKENDHSDWASIANPLLSGWFDANNRIDKSLSLTNDQILRQIAYTALDRGETPFGTSAIKALFDDADALGRFYSLSDLSGNWGQSAVQSDLTKIITLFANNLATNKISNASSSTGIFDYEPDANIISIDFTSQRWSFNGSVGSPSNFSVEKKSLIKALTKGFLNTDDIYKVDAIISAAQKSDAVLSATHEIGKNGSVLFLGDGLNDTILGSAGDDFIFAYDVGDDVVNGGEGINTSFYKDLVSNYKVVKTETGLSVTELQSGENRTDMLTNIQQLSFADEFIPLSDAKGITVIYDFDSPLSKKIASLYEICFDRLPDTDGIRYWESKVETWGNDSQAFLKLAHTFLNSDEYVSTHRGFTNEQFVDDLYRDSFERNADEAGRAHWLKDLYNGADRAHILVGFSVSSEMNLMIDPYANLSHGFWTI